jgi:hypothetical protein
MMARRAVTEGEKKDMTIVVNKETFDWIERTKKATGKSRSWIVEEILVDNLPVEYMEVK